MNINHILVVTAEPKSIFLEILFKYLNSNEKIKGKKITLIGNSNLILNDAKKFKFKKKFIEIFNIKDAKKNQINLINIKINNKKKISSYISECFDKCLSILKQNKDAILFNGPVNKKTFLKKNTLVLPNIWQKIQIQKIL